jgi:outer membrane lipopolysaccharide assembly protein LptE/RlpB
MEDLSKTIAEVKSALDQATQMLDENQSLRDEIQSLKASPNANRSQRELKIAQLAFEQGIESVFSQLRDEEYETEYSIEESCYENGFEVTFNKDVDVSIPLNDIIDNHYDKEHTQEVIDAMLMDEVINQVNNIT